MNYDFPTIKNLNDILPHIEDMDEFKVFHKEWYTVVNYVVAHEETFKWNESDVIGSAIRRECRGLIFNQDGVIISRPYHKFFNVGEKDETQTHLVNLHEPHVVLEKLDGSMIRPIPTKEGFRLATKAGITEVAMNAEVFIADKPKYAQFIKYCISEDYCTPIFEWVSRKNRIVVDYSEDNLILTAIRHTISGEYLPYEVICKYGRTWNIPVVKAIAGDETDITKIVEHIRKWDDGEGVVIRFQNGNMVKIKADDYVLRHKSKDAINQEKNVLQTILDDAVDDLIPLLTSDDAERVKSFQTAFWLAVNKLASEMEGIYDAGNLLFPDKKEFAVKYVQKVVPPSYAPIMYEMKAGKESKQIIVNMIRKSISTQTKIDQNRWLWENLKWN